ncbi:hypothetical protein GCM10011418_00300 [Sphingobacterium alkalisoli]|nr:hypothetical protein [Sphingobacterium alkalisoli]GGH04561.1 hypothetical protein GCM10011418_00300 [Sphingobacterium alkalisoli]
MVPGVASMSMTWSPDISLYTGAANLNIPLYNLEYYNYNLPLGLSYNYNGLKYSDRASIIGLHWGINIPVISRNIVDKDDFNEEKGYFFVKESERNKDKSDMPDIFSLNLPEGSVKFIFPARGDSRVVLRVAEILYEDSPNFVITYDTQTKVISVTTDKGHTYTFDVFVYTKCDIETNPSSNVPSETYISSWYLSKIVLENRQEIVFNYSTYTQKISSQSANLGITMYYNPFTGTAVTNPYTSISTMKTDEIILNEIVWNHGKINFQYTTREDLTTVSGVLNSYKLSKINIYDKSNVLVNHFVLDHSYFNSTSSLSKRLRLDKLVDYGNSISNIPKTHVFQYSSQILPEYNSNILHFGYDSVNVSSAALMKVKYPTGLTTEFQYQNNDYNTSSSSNSSTPNFKHLGARVSAINNYDRTNQLISKKVYEYRKEDNTSSGLVLARSNNIYVATGLYFFGTSNNWFPPIYQSEILGYSDIFTYEIIPGSSTINGGVRYKFVNNPSPYYYFLPGAQADYDFRNGRMTEETVYEGDNINSLREIKYVKYITEDFKINNYHIQMYLLIPGTTSPVQQASNYIKAYKSRKDRIWTEHFKYLNGVRTTSYGNTSELLYPDLFHDYRDFLPIRSAVFTVTMDRFTIFNYAYNYSGSSTTSAIPGLVRRAKSTVVEQITYDNTNKVIGAQFTNFGLYNNLIRPSEFYNLETTVPLTNYTATTLGSNGIGQMDPNYKLRLKDFKYDVYGNLIESTEKGLTTCYIYGYYGKYLLAKVENASYAQVLQAIGGQTVVNSLDLHTTSTTTVQTALNLLRATLTNAHITTYTYKPLVGVESIKDSKGLVEHYIYDEFNRLQVVKDNEQNILKTYKYNYEGPSTL